MAIPKIAEMDLHGGCPRLNANFSLLASLIDKAGVDAAQALRVASAPASSPLIFYGTHADRLAGVSTSQNPGAFYVEADRNNLIYQARLLSPSAYGWRYVSGTYSRTQTQLAALVAALLVDDVGMRIYVSDYYHTLWCTAAATTDWAPEDAREAGHIGHFDVDPGVGWKLVDGLGDDGSAIGVAHPIKILKPDGTTRDNTTAAAQNAGVFLRGAAAYNGAVTPATVPTISAIAATATGGVNVAAAGVVQVAAQAHTHPAPAASLPGPPVDFSDALPYIRK